MSATISAYKRCSVHLYPYLFVRGLIWHICLYVLSSVLWFPIRFPFRRFRPYPHLFVRNEFRVKTMFGSSLSPFVCHPRFPHKNDVLFVLTLHLFVRNDVRVKTMFFSSLPSICLSAMMSAWKRCSVRPYLPFDVRNDVRVKTMFCSSLPSICLSAMMSA
jgi:hypothetical protein